MNRLKGLDVVILPNPDPLGRKPKPQPPERLIEWAIRPPKFNQSAKIGPVLVFLVALSVGRVVGMNAKMVYRQFPELPGNSQQLQETRFFGRRRDIGPILLELMGIDLMNPKEGDLERWAFLMDLPPVSTQGRMDSDPGED